MPNDNELTGVLLIDKKSKMTSHDVVSAVRRLADQRSVGHTGTLDPLAEGLLVLCLGRATKISQFLTGLNKAYEAVVRLGQTSKTFDAEGLDPKGERHQVPELSEDDLRKVLHDFQGSVHQQVPLYSAVSIGGRRLYKSARLGRKVDAPTREVNIDSLELVKYEKPDLHLSVRCGKGTYIRSLANDIGKEIGCGAYLQYLRRTGIGDFSVDDALTLEQLKERVEENGLARVLLPVDRVLPFGAIRVSDTLADKITQGPQVHWDSVVAFEGTFEKGEPVVIKNKAGNVLAVGRARVDSSDTPKSSPDVQLFSYARVL